LNSLVPKRWDQSRNSDPDNSAHKVASGSKKSDSKTTIGDPHLHELNFKSSQTFTDEESGSRKPSESTGVGSQPDWNEYHPEIKVTI